MDKVGEYNIIFISNTRRHNTTYIPYTSNRVKDRVRELLKDVDIVQLDYETTGLDPYIAKLLLCSINIGGVILVVDCTTVNIADLLGDLTDKLVIAHNAKFEYKFSKTNGLQLDRVYCTMVADQRLTMGTGLSSNIIEVCKRRGVEVPVGMDKDVRETFIGVDPKEVIFTDEQILYSACDVIPLEDIKREQDKFINQYGMQHLIYNIEMPLVNILGDCELDGFIHNSKQWLEYAKSKELESIKLIEQLNQYIITKEVDVVSINPILLKKNESRESKLIRMEARLSKLTDKLADLERKEKTHLKSYIVTQETYDKVFEEYKDLTDYSVEIDEEIGINWGSSTQVIAVFSALGMEMPMDKDAKTKKMKPSVSKEARSMWFSDNPESKFMDFFKLYDKYKKIIHNVNSFGEKWVSNYTHPITGRVHTHFFQCSTDTGRLASGDAKNGWFNIQQIPAVKELRSCFVAEEGYEIVTCDLSGAELTIMCSLADDSDLWALSESDDIHSPIATAAWRRVYAHRGEEELARTFLITKEINEPLRKKFKNLTFGSVYGCHAVKAATTVGVSKNEGQIILDGIKASIPKTFNMVENATAEAYKQGYLVSDDRSRSRKWFPAILEDRELEFMEKVGIDGQSRNFKIQS